ncbi:sugar phosphorylase [Anoxybacter fermentans]|uniref:Sucrose 6(F)-phosphate phosphorylase n=1 Tax=Anoxybacter fermentans TaxID=1323375 RepID=A0A3S9SYJ5_9FIRM|nr:sugar phosphorylase [Anoxybacter fermentans]AZR73379.1 sugar phosphorylase [Anoxybacter fermentans]
MKSYTISQADQQKMLEKLNFLYGKERGQKVLKRLIKIINDFLKENGGPRGQLNTDWVDEKDAILITYGDQFQKEGTIPLKNLKDFACTYLKDTFTGIHILPFYPYSSDDGFSVIDYFAVNPELGGWQEVEELSKEFKLMFDGVINHISAKSEWFQEYLAGNPQYKNFFIAVPEDTDISQVTRPRTTPLLTPFDTPEGTKYIWTTFSADQVDLNYANEEVLLKIVELLLFYSKKGAKLIRLDAIGYLWKKLGTTCIHLEETHKVIQLFRDIFDIVDPEMIFITETNVPHKENISYFGNGYNEAQMVYQFPLPPLVLNAFYRENASHLLKWADSLEKLSDRTTFFNFLASHDGIGLMPAKGILSEEEINEMVEMVKARGGGVSYKTNSDGSKSPYELNISYFNALSNEEDPEEIKVKRFLCAHSILLSLVGVPGIYVHSLLGSQNYYQGVKETGRLRSINREKFKIDKLYKELEDKNSIRRKVFDGMRELLKLRRKRKAFHPLGDQKILFLNDQVFSLVRTSPDQSEKLLSLQNVSQKDQRLIINLKEIGFDSTSTYRDIISDKVFIPDDAGNIICHLDSYQFMWIVSV